MTPLLDEIRRCILSEDEIADDASANLKNIRRSIKNINDKIRSQMNTMLNSSDTRTHLQDTVITMRNGRYCLPVKAEARLCGCPVRDGGLCGFEYDAPY